VTQGKLPFVPTFGAFVYHYNPQLMHASWNEYSDHSQSGEAAKRVRSVRNNDVHQGLPGPLMSPKQPDGDGRLGVLHVRFYHSLEFGQDRHFLKVLGAEARPVDAGRCSAGVPAKKSREAQLIAPNNNGPRAAIPEPCCDPTRRNLVALFLR
jgi:hypothetical protein